MKTAPSDRHHLAMRNHRTSLGDDGTFPMKNSPVTTVPTVTTKNITLEICGCGVFGETFGIVESVGTGGDVVTPTLSRLVAAPGWGTPANWSGSLL